MIQTARTTFLDRQNEAALECYTSIELSIFTQAQCFYNDGVRISSKKCETGANLEEHTRSPMKGKT